MGGGGKKGSIVIDAKVYIYMDQISVFEGRRKRWGELLITRGKRPKEGARRSLR